MTISRRSFIEAGAAAAPGLVLPTGASAAVPLRPGTRPIAVSSANGLRGVAKAVDLMRSGTDPLDAAIQGVMIQELDPTDQSVGLVDGRGDIGSVTTTSGLSWKLAGRVGDSPIVGAGQYCDNTAGAAGSTGRGEANIKVCGGFLIVEFMRQGMGPEEACLKVVERVIAMTGSRLLDDKGRPRFDLHYYAVTKDGRYGSASAYEGGKFAVADAKGARLEDSAYL